MNLAPMLTRSLLVLCLAGACLASSAHAEVIRCQGTVTAVNADANTISIERKTAEGTESLHLKVNKKAGHLSYVKVGDTITVTYDSALQVVNQFRKPMAAGHLRKTLKGIHEAKDKDITSLTPASAHDAGFVFGYLMGMGDALSDELHMPVGRQARNEFDAQLLKYLEVHPEKADEPAVDVIREVLGSAEKPAASE